MRTPAKLTYLVIGNTTYTDLNENIIDAIVPVMQVKIIPGA